MAVEREGVSWPTLGLPDSTSTSSSAPAVCYLTVPPHLTKLVTCKLVEGLSSLMVSGSEELVSSVLSVEIPSGAKCPFPLTIALPFRAYYCSSYREITVKAVDRERRVSYITPAATEGIYGGHRGSFAVVRVYSLGVFAVLSRLQKEMFTIPKRGLSLKLCVDPRICLDYQPGSFTTPAIAQVQPVDVMSTLKCRNDSYLSVLSTSPMLYLNHPSTLSPQRPLTLTLPCPPNPDKRTGEENTHLSSLSLTSNNLSPHRVSVLNASVKSSSDASKEQLEVLGCRGEQWNVLDKVSVRNLQNGLVSFELVENYERLIVLRLLSSTRPPCCMSSFVEELEESVRTCAVTIVLQTGREDPGSVALTALPSRELSCGLVELQAQDYWGRPEPSAEISMREGEQLLLRFSGNIISTGDQHTHTITFHSQRRNKLRLRLVELDPFGNHSSPHYRGTAVLFRVTRDQLVWSGDRAVVSDHYCLEEPVCKLSLTLPKTVRTVPRPLITKVLQHDRTEPLRDELLAWLSGELCEEDSALLARCLRLRRSAVQLARIRAPGSLARQTYHMLAAWRRALPSSAEKRPLLARCLGRIGRPELAEELLRRGPAVDEDEWRGVRERVAAEGSEGAHLGTRPSIT
ncbi:death domain-containing protein 1 isoform X2 [Brachyhypopomus gauderio]|uniref:death domain-containing protein 1 isoform X2 n=1 Tax=Brachyhypopomus gauderio TaxID=698409 RepID=UPI004041BD84